MHYVGQPVSLQYNTQRGKEARGEKDIRNYYYLQVRLVGSESAYYTCEVSLFTRRFLKHDQFLAAVAVAMNGHMGIIINHIHKNEGATQ